MADDFPSLEHYLLQFKLAHSKIWGRYPTPSECLKATELYVLQKQNYDATCAVIQHLLDFTQQLRSAVDDSAALLALSDRLDKDVERPS